MKNICEWENCMEVGNYKAPMEKDNSKNYRWLCVEHIKLFNKSWDYFDGMSEEEIIKFLKSDVTWHRPTQKFGSPDNFFNILWNNALNDKFKIFNENKSTDVNIRKLCKQDKDAFNVMGLEFSADLLTLQKKFKTLVKKFHPDRHSGNKIYEDRLKKITLAYSHLKMIMIQK